MVGLLNSDILGLKRVNTDSLEGFDDAVLDRAQSSRGCAALLKLHFSHLCAMVIGIKSKVSSLFSDSISKKYSPDTSSIISRAFWRFVRQLLYLHSPLFQSVHLSVCLEKNTFRPFTSLLGSCRTCSGQILTIKGTYCIMTYSHIVSLLA